MERPLYTGRHPAYSAAKGRNMTCCFIQLQPYQSATFGLRRITTFSALRVLAAAVKAKEPVTTTVASRMMTVLCAMPEARSPCPGWVWHKGHRVAWWPGCRPIMLLALVVPTRLPGQSGRRTARA